MAPSKWEEEEDSTPPSSPPQPAIQRRSKFDDEEDDSDVADNWDEAEDSEVEREKAKKAAEAKAKADEEAAKNKKSKAQRIEERRMENMRKRLEDDGDDDDSDASSEDETDRRARLRRTEQDADLKHAEDLFGGAALGPKKKAANKAVVSAAPGDPSRTIDLSAVPLFRPSSKAEFAALREVLGPLLSANAKKAQYSLFLQEFAKDIAKELPSDQIKKIASGLTALSNEKMKEEKAADKTGKKSKAAKTKATLVANRDVAVRADTTSYGDYELDDDDFM